jgi:heterodisulfide reductase subunit C
VLDSTTIWTCASCYQCMHRCPQEIKITDIMYMLKRMAMRENRKRSKNAAALSRAFFDIVNKKGRNHETSLMLKVILSTKPLSGIALAPIGLGLITHNRLPIFGKKVRDIVGLRKIVAKAKELGGE